MKVKLKNIVYVFSAISIILPLSCGVTLLYLSNSYVGLPTEKSQRIIESIENAESISDLKKVTLFTF